jgi:signal transduction histidine kinase/ligand-binding sensor domain-containing protein
VLVLNYYLFQWAQAQPRFSGKTLFIEAYGLDEGLRQSMVSDVVQDSNGLMWMVTGDGLHCFDGGELRAFRVPFDGEFDHSDNLMRKLVENTTGELLIESTSSLLSFNTANAEFKIIYRRKGSNPVLLKVQINGKRLVWLDDQKLCLIDQGKLVPVKMEFSGNEKLPEKFSPGRAARFKANEILFNNEDGFLSLLPENEDKLLSFKAKWVPLSNCQSMAKDNKGRVFILSGQKLFQYTGNGMLKLYFDTHLSENLSLFIDSSDNFWLTGKTSNRIYLIRNGELNRISLCQHAGRHTDTIAPVIRAVYEDRYCNICMGTDGDGILLYCPDQVQFNRADVGFTRCLEWFDGHLWAGTFNNGIWKLSPDLAEAERISPAHFTNDTYFLDMARDAYGKLWIISRRGFEVIDKTGSVVFSKKLSCTIANFFTPSPGIIALVYDNYLIMFKLSSGSPEIISHGRFTPVATYLNTGGYYWLGNQFGLYRIQKEQGYTSGVFDSNNPIFEKQVNHLIYHHGKIWAATGNGIEIFKENGKSVPLPDYLVPLREEMVYALLSDKLGRIWFTGNRGLACIDEKKKHIVYFSSANNLQSLEFNNNACCLSPDGSMYFGGIRGVNGFDPQKFALDKTMPAVRLISLMVADTALVKGIPFTGLKLKLNRQSPNISGKVFSPDYSGVQNHLFSFYLEGFHKEWGKPLNDASFNFRDLPPGEYRLFAKNADALNNWSAPVEILSVSIRPPFWKMWWFLVLMVAFIAAITAFIVKRINSLRYRKRILALEQQHAIEKERLRISKDMHDEVGASLTRISILSELARKQKNEPEKAELVIGQISEIAGNVVDEMSEIIWAMNPRNDHLDSFVAYVREYASIYLESADIGLAFHFPDEVPSAPMTAELRRNLFLTIKEALHNTVKHARATRVEISLGINAHKIEIRLKDNGQGFDPQNYSSSGNGLHNMPKRLEESGGSFNLTSAPGKGTEIILITEVRG